MSASADNQGAVTSIVALNHEASAFVGYSSGAVAFCSGQPYPCQFYEGTPKSPVTAMDTSRGGDKDNYWVFVGYQNGETYACSFSRTRSCRKLLTDR
jgi:hypothetical protein